jgi:hypothetical protein
MGRIVQLAGVVTLTILCLAGVATFWYAHRGYPDVVYYERVTLSGPLLQPPTEQVELWVDPARRLEVRSTGTGTAHYTTLVDQQGQRERDFSGGMVISTQWYSVSQARAQVADWLQLQRGGFRGLASYRLAGAVGPIAHVLLYDRAALRFDTARHDAQTLRLTVWIDARTHDPLQLRVQTVDYSYTQRLASFRRIDPGTLPAGFFDPPRPASSYWEQALQWLRQRIGMRRGT